MAFWTRVRLSGAAARAPNLPGRFTHQQSFQSSISALSPGGPVLVASSAGKWGLDHKSINRTYIQMIGLPPVCLPLSVFMLLSVCHTYVCK